MDTLEASAPASARAEARPWRRIWEAVGFPVSLYLFSRLALFTITGVALFLHLFNGEFPDRPIEVDVFAHLCRWDCDWYRSIAEEGYVRPPQTNFFPLLPLLARGLHGLTGLRMDYALVALSNLAALGALICVYRVFRAVEDEPAARAALTLFVAYPFAYYQAAGYPESMMVFFSALAVLLALRGRHISAGAALGVGGLARHLTMIAGLSLLFVQIKERGWRPRALLGNRAVLGLGLSVVIVSLYSVFLYRQFGDPLLFAHVRKEVWPGAWASITSWFRRDWGPEIGIYLVVSLIPGLGAFLLLSRRPWWVLAPFGIVLMVVLWRVGLLGLGRYTASCWPAFLSLGAFASRRPNLLLPLAMTFALAQGMFLALFTQGYPFT